ncbi:deoxyribose-phosphate aldolase [Legionella israelensis]|uniref:Deoxyribose-phosphate aldolase n=1 Tax=Legionella israelensis TaxID=454 RepID=A0AAX1EGR6_9GAMM|nr:deoxyribose-phosphate aldolase [Legionella israelensis]QBR84227.1 deoxyribose-phosphate aldolase [Legionella israelensis]
MSVISHFNLLLADVCSNIPYPSSAYSRLMKTLDLTLLDKKANPEQLDHLFQNALSNEVAAVCVYPEHIPQDWPFSKLKKATVINFPEGQNSLAQSLRELDEALRRQADEIDYVFSYSAYQKGAYSAPLSTCEKIIQKCKEHQLTVKVILETGAFDSIDSVYQLSREVISLGCDFIKTSTGKINQGASLSAAFAILCSIIDSNRTCGLKISGGIRTVQQASNYMHLAEKMLAKPIEPQWFRIGSSCLLTG